jgi:hypothetical protein
MKKLSYNEMSLKLKERFPRLEVLDNTVFSKDANINSSFWLRNAESINYTNKDKNTLYQSMNLDYKNYDLEVYKKFNNFCNRFGWYATSESYTLQFFYL